MLRAAITRAGSEVLDFSKIVAKDVGFAIGEFDIRTLPKVNSQLKEGIEATLAETEQAKKDIELLKLKA